MSKTVNSMRCTYVYRHFTDQDHRLHMEITFRKENSDIDLGMWNVHVSNCYQNSPTALVH